MNYNINYTNSYTPTEIVESKNPYFKFIYIVNGSKDIYINIDITDKEKPNNNGIRYHKNEILYIKKNCSYFFSNTPIDNMYEEVEFIFTKEELTMIMNNFTIKYGYELSAINTPEGQNETIISQNADKSLTSYFETLIQLIKDEFIYSSKQVEWVKRAEFIFHVINSNTKYICHNTLYDIKFSKENFIKIVNDNIYNKVTLTELAEMCEMSLSSFKKDFIAHFNVPPHRWFISQRLSHARFLLISTNKEIREIATECCFDNISHFIKLFKSKFDDTPLTFRHKTRKNYGK